MCKGLRQFEHYACSALADTAAGGTRLTCVRLRMSQNEGQTPQSGPDHPASAQPGYSSSFSRAPDFRPSPSGSAAPWSGTKRWSM